MRFVVLVAPVAGRVVRRRDHDAVRGGRPAVPPVVREHRVGDGRGRGVRARGVPQDGDPVGGEHLQGGGEGRFRQCVRVPPEEQGARDAAGGAPLGDRLADGGDVVVVERGVQGGAAMSVGPEDDALAELPGSGRSAW